MYDLLFWFVVCLNDLLFWLVVYLNFGRLRAVFFCEFEFWLPEGSLFLWGVCNKVDFGGKLAENA